MEVGLGLTIPVELQGSLFLDALLEARSGATCVSGRIGYRYNFWNVLIEKTSLPESGKQTGVKKHGFLVVGKNKCAPPDCVRRLRCFEYPLGGREIYLQ